MIVSSKMWQVEATRHQQLLAEEAEEPHQPKMRVQRTIRKRKRKIRHWAVAPMKTWALVCSTRAWLTKSLHGLKELVRGYSNVRTFIPFHSGHFPRNVVYHLILVRRQLVFLKKPTSHLRQYAGRKVFCAAK
jgi:hypothetical protein